MSAAQFGIHSKPEKIMLTVMPYEGEVRDRVTAKFYKNRGVKYMPLGLLSLGAAIPDAYEVRILDAASKGLSLDETLARIEEFAPDILGLSVVTYRAWAMTQVLDRASAPIKVVGGPHAVDNAEVILRQGAHAVFTNDAEEVFPRWLANGCPRGVFHGGQVNLNTIPLPARHLIDINDYTIDENDDLLFKVGNLRLPMFSSKGCPNRCIYCDVQQKQYNFKSPQRCLEEFKALIAMGATSIHIFDDAFNVKRQRVRDFCDLLIEEDIRIDWSARGTVEVREDTIKALSEGGCKRFHVGIESLSDPVLTYFKKATQYRHIERFCNLCEKYNITVLAYFILGAPCETEEYRLKLPQMIEDLGIGIPYFNLLTPLPNTVYYDNLLREGIFSFDHWKKFSAKPVKDFIIPSSRSEREEAHLRAVIDEYVSHFNKKIKILKAA